MTLSTWFRDYVYIPLGGSRGGLWKSQCVLLITFMVSGFWHGPSWHFVAWGFLHALFLMLERFFKYPERLAATKIGRMFSHLLLLFVVLVSWVFFRADSIEHAFDILRVMFEFSGGFQTGLQSRTILVIAVFVFLEIMICYKFKNWARNHVGFYVKAEPLALAVMIWLCVYFRGPGSAFIYFQF